MPSRDLLLKILGDASSAERALNSTGDHAKKLGGHLGGLGKTAALVAGGAGIGLVVEGLKGVIGAAQDAQVSQTGMEAQLKSLGIGYDKHSSQIQNAINKTSKLSAMDDEDLQGAFTRLLPATHNVGKALDEMSLAADIARARHVSLESATALVTRANAGSAGALRKLGISMEATHENLNHLKETTEHATQAQIDAAKAADKHAQAQDNLAKLQSTFSGAAEAYGKSAAGAQDRLKVSFENLQETVGQKVLPILVRLFEKLNDVINFIEAHWPEISAVIDRMFHVIQTVWENVGRPIFEAVITFARRAIDFVRDHWDEISAKVREVFNTIRTIVDTVTGIVEGTWRAFGGTIKTVISNDIDVVEGVFRGVFQTIKGVVNLIDDLIHGRWSDIWGDLKQIVSGVFKAVEAVLEGAVKNVAAIGERIGSGLKDALLGALGGIAHGLANVLAAALNYLIDRWNSFHIHIPGIKLFGKTIVPDVDFDLPNIPHLARGGIVNKPTLALIGENGPEAVVPLNRGGGYGITVNMYGDSYGIEDFVDKAHAGLLRKQQTMNLGFKAA